MQTHENRRKWTCVQAYNFEMDFMKQTCDALREQGHRVGDSYHSGQQLLIVVDDVAMSFADATAVARRRVTVAEIAAARSVR